MKSPQEQSTELRSCPRLALRPQNLSRPRAALTFYKLAFPKPATERAKHKTRLKVLKSSFSCPTSASHIQFLL